MDGEQKGLNIRRMMEGVWIASGAWHRSRANEGKDSMAAFRDIFQDELDNLTTRLPTETTLDAVLEAAGEDNPFRHYKSVRQYLDSMKAGAYARGFEAGREKATEGLERLDALAEQVQEDFPFDSTALRIVTEVRTIRAMIAGA